MGYGRKKEMGRKAEVIVIDVLKHQVRESA